MKEKLKDRYNILALLLILACIIILYQLVNLQIIHGKENDEKSQQRLLSERKIPAPRGNILDRYGVPIAVNRQGFIVQVVRTKLDTDGFNDMILRLADVFDRNGDNYYKSLGKYIGFDGSPVFGTFIGNSGDRLNSLKKVLKKELEISSGIFDKLSTLDDVFKYLRKERFYISDGYSDRDAYRIMTLRFELRGYDSLNPTCIAKDVSAETVAEIEERHGEFPGVTTDIIPVRKYVNAWMEAHVIGYLGIISPAELNEKKDNGYGMNDLVGKAGVELAAEGNLRGKDGQRKIEVDIYGRTTDKLEENAATPGDDVILTLDTRLQKVAMESLESHIKEIREKGGDNNFGDANAGAVVVLDVNSGEVLAMASYQSYDPSIFLAGSSDKEAQKAIADLFDPENASKPAINRAISGTYTPGSTFKPIIAVAGLEEGIIKPQDIYHDSGYINIGGMNFWCMEYKKWHISHGDLTLERALATSCNVFFHYLGYMTGIDNISKWARYFGLGEKTGIDVDSSSEKKGIVASKEYKKTTDDKIWRPADTAQASIGQLYNNFTPLQLANYVSTIANGGKRYKPFLIKKIVKYDGSIVRETKPEYEQVPVKQETMDAVKKGMLAVVNATDGTAVGMFDDLPFKVAGKTGTAETGYESKQSSNALFVCYAPADNPEIAIAVVVERGVWGAYTAPIAHDIIMEYFDVKNKNNLDDRIEPQETVFVP